MRVFNFYVLISFTRLIVAYGSTYNETWDVSISKEKNDTLYRIPDIHIRGQVLQYLKDFKREKNRLELMEPRLGFTSFYCAFNIMKNDLEIIYPECKISYKCRERLIKDISPVEMKLTPRQKSIIEAFKSAELQFGVKDHKANFRIPYYYDVMYGFLFKCVDDRFKDSLAVQSLYHGKQIRREVLAAHGIDESLETEKEKIKTQHKKNVTLKAFSASLAPIFHACNSFHHAYGSKIFTRTKILQKERHKEDVSLAEVLDDMGLLIAWNFNKEDLDNVNLIRKIFDPQGEQFFSLQFTLEKEHGEIIKGMLPVINWQACPTIHVR